MPISVRVDMKTERVIERLARRRGQTKSEVIREAVDLLARQTDETEKSEHPTRLFTT